ncbi:4-hydroxy-tetrahydrodipicolinate synthase [Aliikangiella sp. IMCC44653]
MNSNTVNNEQSLNQLTGSLVALVTPMNADSSVNFSQLGELIDWHIASGTHGLVVMGTTGESALVSQQELLSVVTFAIEHANKRIPIIVGCGAISTQKTLQLANLINPLGPDALLCVTPYYVKPTQAGMVAHFEQVADHSDCPVILYNVPSRTAVDLSNESVIMLAKHNNIVGLKDATGDLSRVVALSQELGPEFLLLSGDDETALEFIKNGGQGVISVTANLAPQQFSQWCELALNKEFEKASRIFSRFKLLNQMLFIEANPIPVKWALAEMKKINNYIREPLTIPEAESQKQINQALKESKLV